MAISDKKLDLVHKANEILKDSLSSCAICPHKCHVNRVAGRRGYCRAPFNPVVYSYTRHTGEEPPISGDKGSGTIFFSHCNMKCVYCQNYNFSQLDKGEEVPITRLAEMMLELEASGCHNINLVSPTHYVPQILMALEIALKSGLTVPIVYNTSGYELPDTIRLLQGIVDIYLPDMRYADNALAKKYSGVSGYVENNRASVVAMRDQVGDLVTDDNGIALRGIIIRLLVLPGAGAGTQDNLSFIRTTMGTGVYLSIMSQYYPTYKAYEYKDISRGVLPDEYANVVDVARRLGLNNGWVQEAPDDFDPKFFGTNIKPMH